MGLGLSEPGFHTRCYVEWEAYPRASIIAAQRAGYFATAPIWDDVTTFDGTPWRGTIDTVLAGYPCQPFSTAGQRKGAADERHLWPDVARIIREVAPEWVFLENVAGHVTLGLDTVLRDLRGLGFTPAAGLFSAEEVGAPHERLRVFIVGRRMAHADGWHPGAEREQRGGEQRLLAAGGGTGLGTVDDAACDDGGIHPGRRAEGCGTLNAGRRGFAMVHAAGIGRGEGRAEPVLRRRRDTAASADGAMADSERHAGYEGRRGHWVDQSPGGTGQADRLSAPIKALFPPGPGDSAAWRDTLAVAPDLAPAAGLGDCLAWARDMAQAVEGPPQAQAQSRLRRMADGLALRSRSLRLLGNGVCPLAAAHAWRTLATAHGLRPVDLVGTGGPVADDAGEPVLK